MSGYTESNARLCKCNMKCGVNQKRHHKNTTYIYLQQINTRRIYFESVREKAFRGILYGIAIKSCASVDIFYSSRLHLVKQIKAIDESSDSPRRYDEPRKMDWRPKFRSRSRVQDQLV